MLIGYVRVSTQDQSLDLQTDALAVLAAPKPSPMLSVAPNLAVRDLG